MSLFQIGDTIVRTTLRDSDGYLMLAQPHIVSADLTRPAQSLELYVSKTDLAHLITQLIEMHWQMIKPKGEVRHGWTGETILQRIGNVDIQRHYTKDA